MAVGDVLYLFGTLFLTSYLKGVVADNEVGHFGRDYIADYACLIIEEGLTEIACIGAVCPEYIHDIGVVQIDFFHLPKAS